MEEHFSFLITQGGDTNLEKVRISKRKEDLQKSKPSWQDGTVQTQSLSAISLTERFPIHKKYSLPSNSGGNYLKKSIYTNYEELPLMLSVKQLVDLLGVSDSTIYELIQEPDFPSLRIGKRIVVPKEELRSWIASHTQGGTK